MNEINSLQLVCIAAMEVCIFYQLVGCSILTILSKLNYDVNFKLSFFCSRTIGAILGHDDWLGAFSHA